MSFAVRIWWGVTLIVVASVALIGWLAHASAPLCFTVASLGSIAAAVFARRAVQPVRDLQWATGTVLEGRAPVLPRSGIPDFDLIADLLRRTADATQDREAELLRTRAGGTAIINAMVEGVIASDHRGRVTVANAAARRMLSYAPDAPLPDLPLLFRDRGARDAVQLVINGFPVNACEFEVDSGIVSLSARALADGAVLVLHDLTDVRRLETVRRDFVANVSHELKTPLTSITGYAETLASDDVDQDTRTRFLNTIIGNAKRMQGLVDDLLDLSRIESGRWEPAIQRVSVASLVADAWELLAQRARDRRVQFIVDTEPDATEISVDAEAVSRVLSNLFDNALRYVPDGGRITCRSEREGSGVTISVADNGSGIPGEHLPRIFERFYRVDPARSRAEGGTGLGLSIARRTVEAHGGRISAESELNHGTTIRCWFPDVPVAG